MIVTYEGTAYEFDQEKITVDEWRELKRKYKMTPLQFENTLQEADPDALTFVYWLLLRQNGGTREPLGDNLKFDMIVLNNAVGEALLAEAEREAAQAEADADPTPGGSLPAGEATPPSPNGSSKATSAKSATNTSPRSPASTGSDPGT